MVQVGVADLLAFALFLEHGERAVYDQANEVFQHGGRLDLGVGEADQLGPGAEDVGDHAAVLSATGCGDGKYEEEESHSGEAFTSWPSEDISVMSPADRDALPPLAVQMGKLSFEVATMVADGSVEELPRYSRSARLWARFRIGGSMTSIRQNL